MAKLSGAGMNLQRRTKYGKQFAYKNYGSLTNIFVYIGGYYCRIVTPLIEQESARKVFHELIDCTLVESIPVRFTNDGDIWEWKIEGLDEDAKNTLIGSELAYFEEVQSSPRIRKLGVFNAIQVKQFENEEAYSDCVEKHLKHLQSEILTCGGSVTGWLTEYAESLKDSIILYDEDRLLIITNRFAWTLHNYRHHVCGDMRDELRRCFSSIELFGDIYRDVEEFGNTLLSWVSMPRVVELNIDERNTVLLDSVKLMRDSLCICYTSCKALGFEIFLNTRNQDVLPYKTYSPIRFTCLDGEDKFLEIPVSAVTENENHKAVIVHPDYYPAWHTPMCKQVETAVYFMELEGLDVNDFSFIVSPTEATVIQSNKTGFSMVLYHDYAPCTADVARAMKAFSKILSSGRDEDAYNFVVNPIHVFAKTNVHAVEQLSHYTYEWITQDSRSYVSESLEGYNSTYNMLAVHEGVTEGDYFSGVADFVLKYLGHSVTISRVKSPTSYDEYTVYFDNIYLDEDEDAYVASNRGKCTETFDSLRHIAEFLVDRAIENM